MTTEFIPITVVLLAILIFLERLEIDTGGLPIIAPS
jgi:hypothetical protein